MGGGGCGGGRRKKRKRRRPWVWRFPSPSSPLSAGWIKEGREGEGEAAVAGLHAHVRTSQVHIPNRHRTHPRPLHYFANWSNMLLLLLNTLSRCESVYADFSVAIVSALDLQKTF